MKWSPGEKMHVGAGCTRLGFSVRYVRGVQIEWHVPVVDRGKLLEEVEAERILRVAIEDRGSAADGLRAETGSGTVGHGHIKGNSENREIDARQVTGIAAPHERKRPGISRVRSTAPQGGAAERVVDRRLANGFGHDGLLVIRNAASREGGRAAMLPSALSQYLTIELVTRLTAATFDACRPAHNRYWHTLASRNLRYLLGNIVSTHVERRR